jgi:hypothetical protein
MTLTNKLFLLLLAPASLLPQDTPARGQNAEPAVEFTTTSNASQVGVNFVLGYQFTVRAPVILNSLGAVLQGNSARPIFGALPAAMPVGVWDDARNLIVSATVSPSDPLIGHFNYTKVADTRLMPGVNYTVAGLVPSGRSVLSDVPAMTTGALIVYGGPRSLASKTLAFPAGDSIALRGSYFGASFTCTGGAHPVAMAGRDRNVTTGAVVKLDGSTSFSGNGSALTSGWKLISIPPGSAAALSGADSPTPWFVPDREGEYVAQLIVDDGAGHSTPSTVSITAAGSAR